MGVSEEWKRPFEISLGELRVVEKTVKVFQRKIMVNGEKLDVDPHEFRTFLEDLLSHAPDFSDGVSLPMDSNLGEFLTKSRMAFRDSDGEYYPTVDFKAASHEFLRELCRR